MFGYQIQGKVATQISTVTILPKRTKEPSLMSDLSSMGQIAVTSQMFFKKLLGYFNNPRDQQSIYGT
jgi:hypothetical protein